MKITVQTTARKLCYLCRAPLGADVVCSHGALAHRKCADNHDPRNGIDDPRLDDLFPIFHEDT